MAFFDSTMHSRRVRKFHKNLTRNAFAYDSTLPVIGCFWSYEKKKKKKKSTSSSILTHSMVFSSLISVYWDFKCVCVFFLWFLLCIQNLSAPSSDLETSSIRTIPSHYTPNPSLYPLLLFSVHTSADQFHGILLNFFFFHYILPAHSGSC